MWSGFTISYLDQSNDSLRMSSTPSICRGLCFPGEMIAHAVLLYHRFSAEPSRHRGAVGAAGGNGKLRIYSPLEWPNQRTGRDNPRPRHGPRQSPDLRLGNTRDRQYRRSEKCCSSSRWTSNTSQGCCLTPNTSAFGRRRAIHRTVDDGGAPHDK
jgi:hypothetical protein